MAQHYRELLAASRLLLARQSGQRGRISAARVRRSVSTTYYALFQFLLDDCTARLVGTADALRRRRRSLARAIDHRGMAVALKRTADPGRHPEIAGFLAAGDVQHTLSVPAFLTEMAATFVQAQTQRHAADYDMNSRMAELDAIALIGDVEDAIAAWLAASSAADRDVKDAVSLLILLKGKLRDG